VCGSGGGAGVNVGGTDVGLLRQLRDQAVLRQGGLPHPGVRAGRGNVRGQCGELEEGAGWLPRLRHARVDRAGRGSELGIPS
jgi:hypothetical protein